MSTAREIRRMGPEALIVVATVVLFVFYYLARADAIASLAAGRGALTVTGQPLPSTLHFPAAALLLAVIPVLFARFALGLRFSELGLGLGRRCVGLAWLAVGVPAAVLAGKIGAANPAMPFVYPLNGSLRPELPAFVPYALLQFLYFGAWEVLFRGVLLFGLERRLGAGPANALQTALSVLAHFGRPITETLVAIPAGLVFGGVNLRTRSIWYIAIVHWLVGVSLDWFILTR